MGKCFHCGAEYSGTRCDNCNSDAVDDPNARPDLKWTEAYVGPPQWRERIRRALEDAGVPTAIPEDLPGWSSAYFGPAAEACVLVRHPDTERAVQVLEALRSTLPEAFPEGKV